jgi:gliding motility-associated-like protein
MMLLTVLFVLFHHTSFSQVNITSTVPSFLYVCGSPDSFSITIYNTSTTSSLISAKLKVDMPAGMFYEAGSVSGSGVSQFNIDTLNKPIFSLPTISPSSSLRVLFYATAGCALNTSSLLSNINLVTYGSSGSYSASSPTYTVKKPSVSISAITNQSVTLQKCYDTLNRVITITNGGTGYLESFTFKIIAEDNLILRNVNIGVVNTVGNTTIVTIRKSDIVNFGDNDSLFEYNESITLIESVAAGGIDSLDESYEVSWGCNSQVCQTNTGSASISINLSNVPYLDFTAYPSVNTCYGGSNASQQQLRIINTGSANAINIDIEIMQTINQTFNYYNNFQTRIDPSSFVLTLNSSSYSLTPISTTATTNYSCFNTSSAVGMLVIRVPEIKVGDTAFLEWDVYSCCVDGGTYQAFGWSYSATYKTPCRWDQTYIKNKSLGRSRYLQRVIFNEPSSPGNAIVHGASTEIGFDILYLDVWPGISSKIYKFTIAKPSCLYIDTSTFTYKNAAGNLQWYPYQITKVGSNITLFFKWTDRPTGFSFVDSKLKFNVTGNCTGCGNIGGYKDVGLTVSHIPNPSCSCEQVLGSQINKVPVVCPLTCSKDGLNRTKYTVYRNSYGQPDNDNNGLADTSGSLDFNKIATERVMYGDTLRITMNGKVLGSQKWIYGYATNTFPENRLTIVGKTLIIYDKSTSTTYQCTNVPHSYSSGTFTYNIGVSALITAGCGIPSSYKYSDSDSVSLVLDYKVTSNIGGASRYLTANSDFYLSYLQNPTQDSAKHSCGLAPLIAQFNIVGYYYTIYNTSIYYPKACESFTAVKGYYLSIGPCCNNYAGGNLFPYEYRPWAKLYKSTVVLPAGYSFVSAYIRHYRTAGTGATANTYVYDLSPESYSGDTLIFDISQYFDNNSLPISDDGFHGFIYVTMIPSKCDFDIPSTKNISWQYSFLPASGFLPGPTSTSFSNNSVISSPMGLKIQGLTNHQTIDTTATWEFSVTNLSSVSDVENLWVKLESVSGNITPLSIKNTTTSTVYYENNGYFNLGDLASSATKNYEFSAYHNTCVPDSIKLLTGWTCDTNYLYSTPLCASDSSQLTLEPLLANLELQVYSQSDTTYLCDTIHYTLDVSNSQRGTAYDTKLQLQILQGLDIQMGSSQLKYPSSSTFRTVSDPVYKGSGIYEWDLGTLDTIIQQNGLSGTEDTSLNSLEIKFSLLSNCNYISGSKFTIKTFGVNACGSQINASVNTSLPTRIYGASEPYIATINLLTDSVLICSGEEKIKVRFSNLGPDSTGAVDHLLLQLPIGMNYLPGSTENIINADSIAEPNIRDISGYKELDWTIPQGIQKNSMFEFEFQVYQDNVLNCDNYPLTFQSVVLDSLICIGTGDTCEFRSSTGEKTDSVTLYKPNLKFSSLSANSTIIQPSAEKVILNISLINEGIKIPSSDTTWVALYHDSDHDNNLSSNDSFLKRIFYPDSIDYNQTIVLTDTLTIDTSLICPVIAVILQDTGEYSNCICDQKIYIIDQIDIQYNLNDTFVCSGDTIQLTIDSLSTYSYQWQPTTDIINANTNAPSFYFINKTSNPVIKTYTVNTYRSNNSCVYTDTVNITVYPQPTTDFQISDSIQCLNTNTFLFWNNANLPSSQLSYSWSFGDSSYSSLDSAVSHTYLDTGSYDIKVVINTDHSCSDSNEKTCHVNINPIADFFINDSIQCLEGNNFSFTNNASIGSGLMTYRWDFGDGNYSNLISPVHSYTSAGTYQVKLHVTSDKTCLDSIIKSVFVKPMPIANFSVSDSMQCINENNFNFNNLSSIPSGSLNYFWNFGDNSSSTQTNPSHTYASVDTFSVQLLAVSESGCKDSISRNVFTKHIPSASFSIQDSGQCLNENSFLFTNSSSFSSGSIHSQKWYFGDGDSSLLLNPSHTYFSDDTFGIQLIVYSDNGCSDTSGKNCIVFPNPISDFSINDSQQCFNNNQFIFTNASSINSGTQTYAWDFGDGSNSVSSSPSHTYATDDTFSVKLVNTSTLGCKDSLSKTVYIFPNPLAGFSVNDSQQCFNENNFSFTNLTSINSGSMSYNWSFGDGASSSATSPSHIYSSDDTFFIKLVINSNLNCSDSAEAFAYVFPSPEPDFSINDSQQCFNNNQFIFTNASSINSGTQTYAWDFGDGSNSVSSSPSHTYATDDTFSVKLVNTSTLGCKDSLSKTVYIFPNPLAGFSVNDSQQCFNENNFSFTNLTSINSGSMSYNWSFGDGASSSATSPSHIYSSDDTFFIKLVINSNLNCSDSAEAFAYVFPSPEPDFSINDSQQCFNNNQFIFTNASSINSGTQTYAWDFGDGSNSSVTSPAHAFSSDDTFSVKLVNTSTLGCKDSLSKTVYIFPNPLAGFSVNDSQQCFNENNFSFTNLTSINSGSMSYNWSFGDGASSSATSPSHIYSSDDTFFIKLVINSNLNCSDSAEAFAYVFPSPEPDFSINDSQQCFNNNQFIFTNASSINSGTQTYAWDFGDGSNSSVTSPAHAFSSDDTFSVKLVNTSTLGCKDSLSKTVYIFPNPLAGFSVNDSQQCFNENNFSFTNLTTINSGSMSYNWSFGDGASSSATSPSHIYSSDDTFFIKLVINSDLNCSDSAEAHAYVFPSPEPDFSINDSQQCFNNNQFIFTNASSINSGTQIYAWDFGDGNSSSVASPAYAFSSDDTFSVKLVNTSALGCKDSISKTVYIFPNPAADFSVNDSQQCFNENNFSFTNLTTINSGSMSYNWSFGDGASSSATSPSHIYSSDDTFFIKLVINSDLNCSDSAEAHAYVFPSPEPDFSINDSQQCFNNNQFIFTNASSINSGTQIYAWDFGDGNSSSVASPAYAFSSDDTFSVKLVNTSALGCKDSISKTVYIFPNPVADFSISDSQQCFNENNFSFTNLTTINSGSMSYNWSFGDGAFSSITSPSHIYSSDDTFFIKLVINSDLNCSDSAEAHAYVFPSPEPDFSINDSQQCFNNNQFIFTNASSINSGTQSYAWDFGDGNNSVSSNPSHTYATNDTFSVKLVNTSALGCKDSIAKTVYIFPNPVADFSISDSQQCFNENNFSFTNLTTINSGSMSYNWSFGDGAFSSITSPSHIYSSDDTFFIKLVINSNLNCSDSAEAFAYVFPSPEPDFSINDSQQCFNNNQFIFTNASSINSGTVQSFNWSFGDNQTSNLSNTNHSYSTTDTIFQVMFIVGSDLQCADTVFRNVYIRPMPKADFVIWDSSQCFENNAFGFQNASTISSGSLTYNWNFDDGSYSTAIDPIHTFGYADTFRVKLLAISDHNCLDSVYKNTYIHVHPEPQAEFTINDSTQCLKWNDFQFSNNSTISSGTYTQTWYLGDNSVLTSHSPAYSYQYHDTFTVKLMIISDHLCKDSTLHKAIVYPMPIMGFSVDDSSQCLENNSFAFSDTSHIESGSFTTYWDFGNSDTSHQSNPTLSYSFPDTFLITLINSSALGCIDSLTRNVFVHPMPAASFSVNDTAQSFKDNQFVFTNNSTISSGTINYFWQFGDGNTSTQTHPVHTYTTDDTFTVQLTVSSGNTCIDTFVSTVYVFPTPNVDFEINDSAQCFNENRFSFTNKTTIHWGNMNYYWYFGDGDTTTLSDPIKIYSSDDTFDVKLVVVSETGAKDSIIKSIIVYPSPLPNFTVNDDQQCLNENYFEFTNNSTINSGSQSFFWNFGNGDTSSLVNPNIRYLNEDTLTVNLIAASNLNCYDTFSKVVYIFPSPLSSFAVNDSQQCLNENYFVFSNSTTISYGTLNYRWSFGTGDSSLLISPQYTYPNDDSFIVSLISNSDLGCPDTFNMPVQVFPSPQVSFTINDSIQCFKGNSYSFTNNSVINSGTQTYLWNFGDGDTSILINPNHNYLNEDTFTVQLVAISDLNCSDTISRETFVLPTPVPSFTINDSSQCLKQNEFVFTNNSTISSGAMNYSWSFGNGDSSKNPHPVYNYPTDDTFNVELKVTSDLHCSDSSSISVFVHPMPRAMFSVADSAQCINGHVFNFTNQTTIKWGSASYYWLFGDGNNSTLTDPQHTYTSDDTFTVTLISTSGLGCMDTQYNSVIVYPNPIAGFSINNPSQCLTNNLFSFSNNSAINTGSMIYRWDFGNGDSSLNTNAVYSYKSVDSFSISLISKSLLGCSDTALSLVYVRPIPVSFFSVIDSQQCLNGNLFTFTNGSLIQYGSLSYLWDFGDGSNSSSSNPTKAFLKDSIYNVSLISESNYNCRDTFASQMTVFPSPKTDFTIDDSSKCLRSNMFQFTNKSIINSGSLSFDWSFGDGSISASTDASHAYKNYNTYEVKLVGNSDKGCMDSVSKKLIVFPMPDAQFVINDTNQCLTNNEFIFTNTSTIPIGTNSFRWAFGDSDTSIQNDPIHTYDTNGVYQIVLIAESNSGCLDSVATMVEVYPMPIADFIFTHPCLDDTVFFTDKSTIDASANLFSWSWDFGNSTTSSDQNPWTIYNNAGNYNVELTVQSNHFCERSITKQLTVYEKVEPTIIDFATVEYDTNIYIKWSPVLVGKPRLFELERATSYGGFQNLVNLNANITDYYDNNVYVDNYSYLYRIRVIDECNYISPYSNIGKTILLQVNDDEEFPILSWTAYEKWNAGVNRYMVEILDEEFLSFKQIAVLQDTFFIDTISKDNFSRYCYRITAFRSGDDVQSESNVACIPTPFNIWVPNAFTPNGDGLNPVFQVKGSFILDYHIDIYNRWGQRIYSSDDLKESWSGLYKGELLPAGHYYYSIIAKGTKGQSKQLSGTILLIR